MLLQIDFPMLFVGIVAFVVGLSWMLKEAFRMRQLRTQLNQADLPDFQQAWKRLMLPRLYRAAIPHFILMQGLLLCSVAAYHPAPNLPPEQQEWAERKQQEAKDGILPVELIFGSMLGVSLVIAWKHKHSSMREEKLS